MKALISSSMLSSPKLLFARLSSLPSTGSIPRRQYRRRMQYSFHNNTSLMVLYRSVKQILLVLRPMDGVAHTFGTKSHKEIHFSLDYIKRSAKRAHDEIMGVLVHEVVHCFQYNALDSCPGGLIE